MTTLLIRQYFVIYSYHSIYYKSSIENLIFQFKNTAKWLLQTLYFIDYVKFSLPKGFQKSFFSYFTVAEDDRSIKSHSNFLNMQIMIRLQISCYTSWTPFIWWILYLSWNEFKDKIEHDGKHYFDWFNKYLFVDTEN